MILWPIFTINPPFRAKISYFSATLKCKPVTYSFYEQITGLVKFNE